MKNVYHLAWISALLLTGCSNELATDEKRVDETNSIVEVTAFASVNSDPQTRLTFVEEDDGHGGKQLKFSWDSEYERIAVFDGAGKVYTFNQVGMTGPSATTNFSGSLESPTQGQTFYAFYPANLVSDVSYNTSEPKKVKLSFEDEKGSSDYKTVLYSKANYSDGLLNFDFKYITSIMKIVPTFKEGEWPTITQYTAYNQTQTTFELSVENGFYKSADLNLEDGTISNPVAATSLPMCSVWAYYDAKNEHKFIFDENGTYFSMLPGIITNMGIKFNFVDGIYEGTVTNSFNIEAGKFYYAHPQMTKVGFIACRSEYINGNSSNGAISWETVFNRITTNDTDLANVNRKKLIVSGDGVGGADMRDGSSLNQTNKYLEEHSSYTKSSIIGNWLRTKAISVEVVDMSGSYVSEIPAYAFYGCSKGDQGNSSLKEINVGNEVKTVGAYAFEKTGVTKLVLGHMVTQLHSNSLTDIQHLVLKAGERDVYEATVKLSSGRLKVKTGEGDICFGNKTDVANRHVYLPLYRDEDLTHIRALQNALTVMIDGKKYAPAIHYDGNKWSNQDAVNSTTVTVDELTTESNYNNSLPCKNGATE